MTQTASRSRPPRLASWLVELFATDDQEESILGDLHEEFFDIVSKSGTVSARRWYWRQTAKTIAHLVGAAFRVAPWSIAGTVLLGFVLRRFSFSLPERIIVTVLRTQRPYSNLHYGFYVWQVTYGIPILHVIVSTLLGCVVALAAKRGEIAATITLALVLCALIGAALVRVASQGSMDVAWVLWSFPDPFATILGGVIVREFRLRPARRHSHT
jgi:hypothetical protein